MTWIASSEDGKWQQCDNYSTNSDDRIEIGEPVGKALFGFGCCISEICVQAIRRLSKDNQEEIFKELFGADGCGFDFCRLSIGANDFAESWYSYNETDGDYEMKSFSIERDRKYIIPAINEAKALSPDLTFFASPWSPPTWMKFPKVYNHGRIVETEENLKAYALYFRRYLEEYAKEGIKISQIHVQNEFHSDQKFPSCVWSGQALAKFIGGYLAPRISDLADIWFGTVNGPENDERLLETRHGQFLSTVMEDEACRNAIKGVSYQWAGKFGITQCSEDHPELDTINSEMECGDGNNSWQYAMYGYEMMHHYFKFGARACVYWNMALCEGSSSTWGWKQNSLISVKDDGYEFTPDFYMFKHFAAFVKKGAVMLKTKGHFSTNVTVFRNPSGERVAVIMNPYEKEKVLEIEGRNYVFAPRSFNTLIL